MNPTPATSSGLEAIETASRDELTALQLERLCNTLHRAYEHVALYRNKFEQAGIHPDDIKSLEDLVRLPVTTKEDLRDQYPFGLGDDLLRDDQDITVLYGRPLPIGGFQDERR